MSILNKKISINKGIYTVSVFEDILIVFLYIFGLKIPIIQSSSILLGLILPIRLLFYRGATTRLKHILLSKYVLNLIFIYILIETYALAISIIHTTLDFTISKTLINCIIHIIIATFIVTLFYSKNRKCSYLIKIIISCFIIQSIIELSAFTNENVLRVVQLFQSDSSIELAGKFAGRRGLALAGTVFFGLSTTFGLSIIFLTKLSIDQNGYSFKTIASGIIIFIGGFFTGRTFFIGVIFATLYYYMSTLDIKTKFISTIKLFISSTAITILLLAIIPESMYNKIINLFLYVFEAAFNYQNSGHLTTTSTDALQTMYFPLNLDTYIFGDGRYTNEIFGGYYMGTDAGYMRNILLFGIPGFFLCVIFDVYLLWGVKKLRNSDLNLFSFTIFMYIATLHYKGEAFAYLLSFHCILFLYYILYTQNIKDNENRHINLHLQRRCL